MKERQNLFSVEVLAVCFIIRNECASGAAAPAAIFAGVQPSRLILSELPLSGDVVPGILTVQPSRLDSLACCKPRHTKMQTSAHSGSEKTVIPSHFWLPKT